MSPDPCGWSALAALTERRDARCTVCHAPALTQLAHDQDWRRAAHPGEWGHDLNWTPRAADTCTPHPLLLQPPPPHSPSRPTPASALTSSSRAGSLTSITPSV